MIRSIAIPLIMIILVIRLVFVFSEIFSFFDLRSKYQEEVQEKTAGYPFTCCAFIGVYHLYCIDIATSFLPVYILKFVGTDIGIPRD